MYPSGTLISVRSRIFRYNQIWQLFFQNFMLINNSIERESENKYFPPYCPDQFITPNSHPPQYENILFSIKYRYTNNNFYAILAWCCRLGLRIWFNLLGLKLQQCLDSLFFGILRSYCSILFKVKMFILV